MQEIVVDFNELAVYEAGAGIVAILAYPDSVEKEKRTGLYLALCSLALRARSEIDVEWSRSVQVIHPSYAFHSDREISKSLKTLKRRLRDRMIAGRMALAFLKEVESGKVPTLPKGIQRLSINQMSELVLEDAGQTDPENVETRIWRPSLPVVHLAAAIQVLFQQAERETGHELHLGHLTQNREVIEHVIRTAEDFRQLLAKSPRININPDTQVRIRLAPSR